MPPQDSTVLHLAREIRRLDRSQISYPIALRNTIGVVAPLAAGVAVGHADAGLTVAVGALNVAFSDGHDPYRVRAVRMLGASALSALSVFVGSVVASHHALAVAVAALWAFAGGMIVLLGPVAGQIGLTTLVLLIVFGAEPLSPSRAAGVAALVFAGGMLQTLLALGGWPARGLAPERRTLAAAWRALAAWARAGGGDAHDSPPATVETTVAADILATARADRGPATEALVSLFNQLERTRLDLVSLVEQPRRSAAAGRDDAVRVIDALMLALGDAYHAVATSLDTGAVSSAFEAQRTMGSALAHVDEAVHRVEQTSSAAPELGNAAHSARALAGQVRAAAELGARVGEAEGGAWESIAVEPSLPPALRVENLWPRLRANITTRSAAFRHAVRLSVCVALGEVISRGAALPHGYWVPMTVAIVLKPDFTATVTRGIARLGGTLLGLVVASLVVVAAPGAAASIVVVALLVFMMRGYGRANYMLLAVGVTALIVVLFSLVGAPPIPTMEARAIATTGGGALALVAYALWPTWERTQTPLALADLLDAYRDYFAALAAGPTSAASDVERRSTARQAARLARTNAEASVDRMRVEPRRSDAELDLATRFLAASRRFARETMVLEATVDERKGHPPRVDGFDVFARDVDATLRSLAARLRGAPVSQDALPDLRAEQLALRSVDGDDAGVTSVLVETDRIANAMNTIAALVQEMSARA